MIREPLNSSGFNRLEKSPTYSVTIFLVKLKVRTTENSINAIPNTYINMKLITEVKEMFTPVIIMTAIEDAQGSIPVKSPTIIGLSIFDLENFPC